MTARQRKDDSFHVSFADLPSDPSRRLDALLKVNKEFRRVVADQLQPIVRALLQEKPPIDDQGRRELAHRQELSAPPGRPPGSRSPREFKTGQRAHRLRGSRFRVKTSQRAHRLEAERRKFKTSQRAHRLLWRKMNWYDQAEKHRLPKKKAGAREKHDDCWLPVLCSVRIEEMRSAKMAWSPWSHGRN